MAETSERSAGKDEGTQQQMKAGFIRILMVCALTGLPKSSVYELMARGEFPRQIRLGRNRRCVAWSRYEIEGWMAERFEESRKIA